MSNLIKWWSFKTGYNTFLFNLINRKRFFSEISFYSFFQELKICIFYSKFYNFSFIKRFPFFFLYEFNHKLLNSSKYLKLGTTLFLKNYEIFFDYFFQKNIFNFREFVISLFFRKKKVQSETVKKIKKYILFRGMMMNGFLRDLYLMRFEFNLYLNIYKKKFIFSKFSGHICNRNNRVNEIFFFNPKKNLYMSGRVDLIVLKNVSMRNLNFFYQNTALVFFWLKKKWNQKRFFAFLVFRRIIFKFFQNISINFKKKKFLAKKQNSKKRNVSNKLSKIRSTFKSPSSKRTDKILVVKLAELSRDFYPVIRRQSFELIILIFTKGYYSRLFFLFFSKKIVENIGNKFYIDKLFIFDPKSIKISDNQFRIYENIEYLNLIYIFSFFEKKKIFFDRNVFYKRKKFFYNDRFIKYNNVISAHSNFYENDIYKSFFTSFYNLNFFFFAQFSKKNFMKIKKAWKKYYLVFFLEFLKKKKRKDKKLSLQFYFKLIYVFFFQSISKILFFLKNIQSFLLNILSKEARLVKNLFLEIISNSLKLFKNHKIFIYILNQLEREKTYLRKKCYLSSLSFTVFLFPNFLPIFLKKTSANFFSIPCSNVLESFFFSQIYFLKVKQENLTEKNKKLHQNHSFFLILGRILINLPKKDEKIWYSFWEGIFFFFNEMCMSSFILFRRIKREIYKKDKHTNNKQKKKEYLRIQNKNILLVSQYLANNGRFFFWKKIKFSDRFSLPKNNRIYCSKKKLKFFNKKLFNKKKIKKIKKFMKWISNIMLKKSREGLAYCLLFMVKFFCLFFNCQKNVIYFIFFFSSFFSFTELSSISLIFFSEIIASKFDVLQKNFQKIPKIFEFKDYLIFRKLFLFLFKIVEKEIFKPNFNSLENTIFSKVKKITNFKIKNFFILNMLSKNKNFDFQINLDFLLTLIGKKRLKELDFKMMVNFFHKMHKNFKNDRYIVKKTTIWFKVFNKHQKRRKIIYILSCFINYDKEINKFIERTFEFYESLEDENFFDQYLKILLNIGKLSLLKNFFSKANEKFLCFEDAMKI
ncbi:hypothetical protein CMESO_174 (nucleomorph) [Chroomonas mesostigmatica CCMP1168]|uniref:Uncharacterized protein n=1 Tax=Chroomonas mesostigmatica CCMP1168 TaxID=1195612 RepID=J7GA49_9CRYP|nr:hypothetical protein CMESO_174 [Chroomonas mesostigmatica CCMP1168]